MNDLGEQSSPLWGGSWTGVKLTILGEYLKTYTTILKKQSFHLTYFDAFAGTGAVEIERDADEALFLAGSPVIALEVDNKPFDSFVFVEHKRARAEQLRQTIQRFDAAARAQVIVGDANAELRKFCHNMGQYDRAVVFLDPFALDVEWQTVEAVATSHKCDTWILFPISALLRTLPVDHQPVGEEATAAMRVFGDDSWTSLYRSAVQLSLSGEQVERRTRNRGIDQAVRLYAEKLHGVFYDVAKQGGVLKNSKNSPLFVFMFAAGNKAGAERAIPVASHIIAKMCDETIEL